MKTRDNGAHLMHNPNSLSCAALGGIWVDSTDFSKLDCLTKEQLAVSKGQRFTAVE